MPPDGTILAMDAAHDHPLRHQTTNLGHLYSHVCGQRTFSALPTGSFIALFGRLHASVPLSMSPPATPLSLDPPSFLFLLSNTQLVPAVSAPHRWQLPIKELIPPNTQ